MGEEIGLTLKERLDELEKVVIDYEKKLHLDKIKINEVDLDVKRETMLKMDSIDINAMCAEWAYYSMATQKELNVSTSRYNWAESILDQYLAENSQNYPGYGYKEKCAAVIAADSFARKVEEFKRRCKMVMDRNAYVTSKIDFMIKMAQSVAYLKKGEKNE